MSNGGDLPTVNETCKSWVMPGEVQFHLNKAYMEQNGHSMVVVVRNSCSQEKITIAWVSALAKIKKTKLISLTRIAIFKASSMSHYNKIAN